ncbi:MAG: glycoside hydrolase family 2 protein [Lachnospiraceae bacterium]|nr:glycoside hydrolase family 2 protein [Lachnospiraceae bacterium]
MRNRFFLNDNWMYTSDYEDRMLFPEYDDSLLEVVRIPHTVKESAFNYFDESEYQKLSLYRKHVLIPEEWKGKCIKLTFEGAAHYADVYINGDRAGRHYCGYTAFTIDVSELLKYGSENLISVKLDSREDLDQPPFGHVIDYMTYGGLYRDVYLDVHDSVHMERLFVYSSREEEGIRLHTSAFAEGEFEGGLIVKQYIRDHKGDEPERQIAEWEVPAGTSAIAFDSDPGEVSLWYPETPFLVDVRTELIDAGSGKVLDEETIVTGVRFAEWRTDGFYLNGEKYLIRGLNRHQSFPYVGYAMPDSLQKEDARILKDELGVNAVRTSHYPQSHAFISQCDKLGLLVFMEIPGWQHIGGEEWKEQAVANVSDMVLQYRNHPSIVLWGVRINESGDDHDLYVKTNDCARSLDPSRQTGGVRCSKKSELLEDVYTYNDFSYTGGKTDGCASKKSITSDVTKPYLVTEYGGHIFPTKSYDDEAHRTEHSLRHAKVLSDVAASGDIAGSFGWCMFDYNTHKDFGSGDRICYHGVLDMFRNHKLASYVYASQGSPDPVLELSSSMDIGEHPESRVGEVWIYTNADSVKMYKNDILVKEYFPSDSPYSYLPHGPILVDDYVGDSVRKGEDFTPAQAEDVKYLLNQYSLYGMDNLGPKAKAIAAKCLTVYRMTMDEAYQLYGKYIGNWGGEAVQYRFDAIKDGEVVKSVVKESVREVRIVAESYTTELIEGKTYDVAAVRIRAEDQNGNLLPYFNEPVLLRTEGPVKLIGPSAISLKGGMGGTYLRTTGGEGEAMLQIVSVQGGEVRMPFDVKIDRAPQM